MPVSFTFQTVGKIVFGVGTLGALKEEIATFGRRALIITGRHAIREGEPIERLVRLCREADVEAVVFDSPPTGEPDVESVDRARRFFIDSGCDSVIGFGGGSILDLAKAVAGLAHEPAPTREYFEGRPIATEPLPWIAIPTVAGAGAEVTKNAVLTDPATFVKQSIRDDRLFARVVIVDPGLMTTCPPRVTADSGADALAQAIESYTSLGANPMTDALAFEAVRLIMRSLAAAWRDGSNLEARSDLALGSLLAGVALANARLGTIHGLAHPIGARWNIPHGRVCAILLAPVMRFNAPVVAEKYDRLSSLIEEASACETLPACAHPCDIIEYGEAVREELEIPADLQEYRITPDEMDWIIRESLPSGSLKMNPRPTSAEDLRRILEPLL